MPVTSLIMVELAVFLMFLILSRDLSLKTLDEIFAALCFLC